MKTRQDVDDPVMTDDRLTVSDVGIAKHYGTLAASRDQRQVIGSMRDIRH